MLEEGPQASIERAKVHTWPRNCKMLLPLGLFSCLSTAIGFQSSPPFVTHNVYGRRNVMRSATVAPPTPSSMAESISSPPASSFVWSESFTDSKDYAAVHSLFSSLRSYLDSQGLPAQPFYTPCDVTNMLPKFTTDDLQSAIANDFLDAGQGSTDKNKGWKMKPVGSIGATFEEARLSFSEVSEALNKGTVIFNSAGAHIPEKLAPSTLAALDGLDGAATGVCLNMYVTKPNSPTSAPPHTDKQDVLVIQTQGQKHWRVYSPPDSSMKPTSDPFARGKGSDNLPLHLLKESGSELLLDVVMSPGDVLFVPARFPHTTDTVVSESTSSDDWSIHLTYGLDTHVWDMDYKTLVQFTLQRNGLAAPSLTDINSFSSERREKFLSSFSKDLLSVDAESADVSSFKIEKVASVASSLVSAESLTSKDWISAVTEFKRVGENILHIHRDMYISAIEEGRRRREEGWAVSSPMPKDKMDRLSVFRVPKFFQKLDENKDSLLAWANPGAEDHFSLPEDWASTFPLSVGDAVESELGGAFFDAVVKDANNEAGVFDVQFFDGEWERGVPRQSILLKSKPSPAAVAAANNEKNGKPKPSVIDTTGLTKKEIKRLRKEGKL